ncbi:MAG: diguanylate cyclase, partial [bacterium]|nr:diguanylate cyclase [bacterium]
HQRVTVSMGIALYRGDRKRLFSEADRALYRAKAAGRDCVPAFGDDIDD